MENIDLNNNDNIILSINKYINEKLKVHSNYQKNIEELKKLILFLSSINYESNIDDFITLINSNFTINLILKSIVENTNKKISDDEIITDIIDAYCIINDIDIETPEEESTPLYSASTMQQYINEVSQYPILTKEEEIDLVKKVKMNDKDAYEYFLNCNLRLVIKVAKAYQHPHMDLEDLIQEGNLGLMNALKKFDVSKGYKFSTYATHWIRSYIRKSIVNKYTCIRIPMHAYEKLEKVKKAINQLSINGIELTIENISKLTGLTTKQINELKKYEFEIASLDVPVKGDEENDHLKDFIPGKDNTEEEVLNKTQNIELLEILKKMGLSEKEIFVLIRRNGFEENPLTLAEIGKQLNITRERVRQIEEKALRKIRKSPYLNELCDLIRLDQSVKKYTKAK